MNTQFYHRNPKNGYVRKVHEYIEYAPGRFNIRCRKAWYSLSMDIELWEFNPNTLALTLIKPAM